MSSMRFKIFWVLSQSILFILVNSNYCFCEKIPVIDTRILTELSNSDSVYITGRIEDEGIYSIKDDLKLLDIISIAGGFKEGAKIEDVKILRGTINNRKIISVDIKKLLDAKKLSNDMELLRGDVIFIPDNGLTTQKAVSKSILPALSLIGLIIIIF